MNEMPIPKKFKIETITPWWTPKPTYHYLEDWIPHVGHLNLFYILNGRSFEPNALPVMQHPLWAAAVELGQYRLRVRQGIESIEGLSQVVSPKNFYHLYADGNLPLLYKYMPKDSWRKFLIGE